MPLPELIEIQPLTAPVHARIAVPGSKSITNRALILAALGEGQTTLQGALWSEDTQVMVQCLRELGFMINIDPDPDEPCNRTITVYGMSGRVPRGGTPAQPLQLFVGNAGTAARFLTAFLCLGEGVYRLQGVPRMHQRPQAALFHALRQLGYRLESLNDKLPVTITGGGRRPGQCQVSITESSQFASALFLAAKTGGWQIDVLGENSEQSPYVQMTRQLVERFQDHSTLFQIEPDASSGSYFYGADWLLNQSDLTQGSRIQVAHWPTTGWQIDEDFPSALKKLIPPIAYAFAANEHPRHWLNLLLTFSRQDELGDAIMTAIVLAPFYSRPGPRPETVAAQLPPLRFEWASLHNAAAPQTQKPATIDWPNQAVGTAPPSVVLTLSGAGISFTDLGRLRVQECERVQALKQELLKCGANVLELDDTLRVFPSHLHGAEIETYQDHRMAMCFALLSLKVPGLKLKNPSCVKKTFPNFFQKLAAPPPTGLGAVVLNALTGRPLALPELFAH